MINIFPKKHVAEFKNLWDSNANEYAFYDLMKKINPRMTFKEFDRGWQYTTVLNENYKTAKNEFLLILNHTF